MELYSVGEAALDWSASDASVVLFCVLMYSRICVCFIIGVCIVKPAGRCIVTGLNYWIS